jgi:hypothetical protein
MKDFGHGSVGTREQSFTNLLPLRATGYPPHLLTELSAKIAAEVDTVKDGADAEENLWVPAGYTYFGQFIDHDLTFDNTSSLNPLDAEDIASASKHDRMPSNLRTPRFDLDSLYGDGPDAQPFMYGEDGASLLLKDSFENQCQSSFDQAHQDLLRSPNGRAVIGDKRNDENSLVSQIHLTFIKFHNAVVAKLKIQQPDLKGTNLFETARREVRWAYQNLVIEDFLPRIVQAQVMTDLKSKTVQERQNCYALYTVEKRTNLPLEFVGAAYRFGHSGVRFGYRLNTEKSLSIFSPSDDPNSDSLLGFDPLPESHVIDDWRRFFPNTKPGIFPAEGLGKTPELKKDKDGNDVAIAKPEIRLQFAYKIDTTLVDPLTVLPPNVLPTSPKPGGALKEIEDTINSDPVPNPAPRIPGRPSLALLNLLRGSSYKIQGGQEIAKVLREHGHPVEPLDPKYLVTRRPGGKDKSFKFEAINSELQTDTPLWFYILAEAQKSVVDAVTLDMDGEFNEKQLLEVANKTQLGWVGGRIVAEVFYGLMDSDKESYFHAPPAWKPIWQTDPSDCHKVIFADLLKFAGQPITPPPIIPAAVPQASYTH